jgi:hypothetical protein
MVRPYNGRLFHRWRGDSPRETFVVRTVQRRGVAPRSVWDGRT